MRFFTLLLSFFLAVQFSVAQIPVGYYDSATGTGDVLRANLRDIITAGHVKLPYTSTAFDVWDAYAYTDVRPVPNSTVIWDMYSDIPSGSPVYTFTIFTDQCGSAATEGDCYSREHQMPNSWWGGLDNAANPQYSDLHHLPPTDQYVNNRKSNYIVAETTAPTWTSTNGSRIGPCSLTGFTGTIFEPINEYKGDFARAYLYLATRYMDVLSVWRNTYTTYDSKYIIATSGGNYLQWYIDLLVRWHNQDPVSQKEIDRNNAIYYNTPQHNRNPYIDHPEYVCLVWTSSYCTSIPVITNIVHTPTYPGPANTVSVTANITDDGSITSAVLQWCTDGVSFGNSIAMNLNGAPNYIASSSIPAQAAGTTVTYRILATDDGSNTTTSAISSYTVLKAEPTNHPTGFTCGTSTSTSITLPWVDATGTVVPDGYLIKASTVSLAAISDPIDGVAEANSTYVKNVSSGLQSVSLSGLPSSTTVYFKIYPYTNSSVNINYKTAPSANTATCSTSSAGSGGACATDLIISEYVEGSGNTKYIEVYNGTGAAIDLSDYKLLLYANGATTPNTDYTMSGILADHSVVVYSNASATIYTTDTVITTATFYNGNDALGLYKTSTASYVDIFGRIGENPGTAWISGTSSTLNMTLVRNSDVYGGITSNPASGFPTLGTEWTAYAIDDVTHLGSHTMACAMPSTTTASASAGCSTGSVTITSSVSANQTFYLLSGVGAPIANWTGNTDTHVFTGLTSGNYKGYTVNAGVYSDTSTVVVLANDPTSVGGNLSNSNTEICLGDNTGLIILSGYTGTITKWEASNDAGTTWSDLSFYDEQYSENIASAGTWIYRVEVVSGSCAAAYSGIASIIVDPTSVGGTLSGPNTQICFGSNTGVMTVATYTGAITKWQKRVSAGGWVDIANTAATYSEVPSSAGTWDYRAEVQSGSCSVAYSNNFTIVVDPTSVGGSVTPATATICLGSPTGTLTLGGNTGTVVKWQKSNNGGSTWTDIANTAITYSETPLTAGTWLYRAVVQSGSCTTANSASASITVNPISVGGSVSGGVTEICLGSSTGTLTLTGNVGTITKWQKSNNGGSTWTDITNTAATYSETPGTAGTWLYRAVVQSGICSISNSASFSIVVDPVSIGGTVTAGVTQIYLGDNTGSITLASNVGAIVRWEKRLNSGSWTPIASTANPYSEIPTSVGFWDYRAVVQTGTSCSEAYSNFVQIEVLNSSGGTVSGGNSPICLGSSTGTMTLSGYTGTIIRWQKSNDGGSTWTNIVNTGTTCSETPVIAGTWLYRAEIFTTVTIYSAPQSIVVNPTYAFNENHSICNGESYSWQGSTYTAAGTYSATYSTVSGCDSVYTLNLTVNPTYAFNENHSICNGESYSWQGSTYTAAGTYNATYSTVTGCDSVYTLNLSVNPDYSFTETDSICQGDVINWHGMVFSSAGTYYDSLLTQTGCDSVYALNLTINDLPIVWLGNDTTICSDASITLDAGNTGAAFTWSEGGSFGQSITLDSTGHGITTFNVWVSVDNGCQASDTIAITFDLCDALDENGDVVCFVYPNPTDGLIQLFAPGTISIESIEIRDVHGKLIYSGKWNALSGSDKQKEIDLSIYMAGVYFLEVKSKKSSSILRIVRQ